MGYKFACDNVVPGCEGEVSGETIDDVMAAVADHAASAHGINEVDDALAAAVKAGITQG